ncbi:MAG: ornithine carbamoyltransferase [Euryarchaeota archaeon]|nr:ornithine carbamoyltransferase [Euryarchaeota archaeon]
MKRDFISVLDLDGELEDVIDFAIAMKARQKRGKCPEYLRGKFLGMIFEKPSLRTRVSFEIGMRQLGGTALYLSPSEIQVGRRESVHDVAKVMSRFVDGIMYRAFDCKVMRELARHAEVPVINGLDNLEHPCQILADLQTVKEHKGKLKGLKLAWIGDGNNVCNSLLLGTALAGMDMSVATPEGYGPNPGIVKEARKVAKNKGALITLTNDVREAAKGADVLATDTWVSMGDEAEKAKREAAFKGFQINARVLSWADRKAIVLHCLPAHRGQEITSQVMDGPHSVVFDEAENRLHAQKAIMARLMKG